MTGGGGEQLGVELGFGEVVPPRRVVRIGTRRRPAPPPGTGEQCRVSLRLAPEAVDARGLVAHLRPRGQQLARLAGVGEPEVEPRLLEPVRAQQDDSGERDSGGDHDGAQPARETCGRWSGQGRRRAEGKERERRQPDVLRLEEVHGEHEEGEAGEWCAPAGAPDRQTQPREEQPEPREPGRDPVLDDEVVGVRVEAVRPLVPGEAHRAEGARGPAVATRPVPQQGTFGDGVAGRQP